MSVGFLNIDFVNLSVIDIFTEHIINLTDEWNKKGDDELRPLLLIYSKYPLLFWCSKLF